ncbi:permease-like cell division protein FtsX [Aliiglaciecola sp. LCG003]|uniref:permease-like cell division protein FtsX n=1 Tax=Aliiglaciecola sp. LCG003 TaxID=3053655 RepID=UPI002572218E|nr:permease-like cell division protein FtsX [Aliiglaciecola sp. LCG003]WJG09134.1 permease-like cell division protein FtsX [Aliiglaciecola sp. LCG003]
MSILFTGRSHGAQTTQVGLVQRILMFFVSHVRQALSSLGELWRAPVASLMTIGVLGLSITLPSTFYILVKNAEHIADGWEQASEITLFLQKDIKPKDSAQLVTRLGLWSEIDSVSFIPADQGLKEFQQLSGLGDALDYLSENPLPDVVLVKPLAKYSSPTAAKLLLEKLRNERFVEQGKLDIKWLERLHGFLSIAKELIYAVALLLFLAVVLIIGNTIRLNILSRRDEILVMKLVGATDAFIHRPFMYTGFWYGLLGGLMAWFAVLILLWWMGGSIDALTAKYDKNFDLTGMNLEALLVMLGVSVFLGLAGSMISVHRHVRGIEPK